VLVTAGGTLERIDPVRYITNDSSGKMGYAIAQAAQQMGASVTLVSANVSLPAPAGVDLVKVVSTRDMYDAVMARLDEQDLVIKAAAVADYRPAVQAQQKIKKKDERLTLELERTEDILAEIGRRKSRQFVVGFAAETHDLEANAMKKVISKNCDLVAANNVSSSIAGFRSDHNELKLYDASGLAGTIPLMPKLEVARQLLRFVAERMRLNRRERQ
jgi:phosphopantothenoylcysteine decarboxylase/phosphopantothenate--cysteine ligase